MSDVTQRSLEGYLNNSLIFGQALRFEKIATVNYSLAAGEISVITDGGVNAMFPTTVAALAKVFDVPVWATALYIQYKILAPGATNILTTVGLANDFGVFSPDITIPHITMNAFAPESSVERIALMALTSADNYDNQTNSGGWERPANLFVGPKVTTIGPANNQAIGWTATVVKNTDFDFPDSSATVSQFRNSPLAPVMGCFFQTIWNDTPATIVARQPNYNTTFEVYGVAGA